ncbi:hypothetical protein F5883DRAFT_438045 [Diaporthe sp. PMI_573]|nr:hypothetical protein F5883DRAFT_438045 [Diaporthaceae sp. PMI_573]
MKTSIFQRNFDNVLDALRFAAKHTVEGIVVYPPNRASSPTFSHHVEYRELLELAVDRAKRLSKKLQSLERPASQQLVVILHFDNVLDTIEWYWAVLLCGGVPAITSPSMLSHEDEDRKRHLAHLKTIFGNPICFTRRSLMLPFLGQEEPANISTHAVEDLLIDSSTPTTNGVALATGPGPRSSDIAALMLTSGSSGNAKAVPITHQQILAACVGKAQSAKLKFPDSPFLSWVQMDHVANLVHCHLFAIISGVSQIHVQATDALSDPVQFLNLLSRHHVSRTFAPNFFLAKLRRVLELGKTEDLDQDLNLEALYLDTGGEANVLETCIALQCLLEQYGAPKDVISPSFGMTETCAGCIFNNQCPTYDTSNNSNFACLGDPMPGLSMRITKLEPSKDRYPPEACPWEQGHLELTGMAVFRGYFGNPAATAEAFTADGWFRTGDLAYLDDCGKLHLSGRTKELVNINGVKYLPIELDSALEQAQIPGAVPSFFCCFSTRDETMSTEEVVVLYLASFRPDDDKARFDTQSDIIRVVSLRTRSRPRVVPLRAEQFQKSSLGKLPRAKLKTAYDTGFFSGQQSENSEAIRRYRRETHGPPADQKETIILDIIRQQLELNHDDDLMATDSIFTFGATSMDFMTIKSRINSTNGLALAQPLELIDLLNNPTARGIASRIRTMTLEPHQYDPIVVLQPNGSKTPLWIVHPGVGEVLVFVALARYFSDRPVYAFRAKGFNRSERSFGSLDELVDTYHASIKKHQSSGPYAIAGYSFGGMVAFEVAKVLEAGGNEVRLCAPFNLPPHIKWRMRELVWDECVMHLFYFVELMEEETIYRHKKEICRISQSGPDGQLDAIRYLKLHCDQFRWVELGLSEEDYLHWVNIASGMQGLAVDYEPSGTVQTMDVFVAEPLSHVAKSREEWVNGRLAAWKDFVFGGNLRFHHVQGGHYTMLNPKYVDVSAFAEKLQKLLEDRGL